MTKKAPLGNWGCFFVDINFIKLKKKKDRFELYLFGTKWTFYRYLRIIREFFLRIPCGHRKTCSIPETRVYKWLNSDKKEPYFWNYNEANVYIPESKKDSQKRMEELALSLMENYDPSKCIICVRKNNIMIDGQHRAAVLYQKYGGDYKVLVAREK